MTTTTSADCPECGFKDVLRTCAEGTFCTRCKYIKPKDNGRFTIIALRHESNRERQKSKRTAQNEKVKVTYGIGK